MREIVQARPISTGAHSSERAEVDRKQRWCERGLVRQLFLWLASDSLHRRRAEEERTSPWSFLRGADFSLGNMPAQ